METIAPPESRTVLPFAQHHAFIIGIDDYEQVSPLQTAVRDAQKLAEVLETQQHFRVHLLLNAKGAELRDFLQKTLHRVVGIDDRALIYFAGHGIAADGDDGPAGFLVPADADPTDVKTFLPMEEVQRSLDALPCRHLLLILDCCFSGAFKWSSRHRAIGTLMPKKIYKERFDRFVQDWAWQVITSAASDQKALDVLHGDGLNGKVTGDRGVKKSPEGTHSPFALALFNGLNGEADVRISQEGDGVITATELYAYIRDQIEPATIKESQKQRQTPGFFPLSKHDKGEFIFLHPRHRLNLPPIPKRNPYKGLQSFDEADKELFYGRDRVIKELREKAESNKLLVVSGASGTGKSSVIKAGLLPLLREEGFRILPVIRPGVSPLASLEQGLKEANLIEGSGSLQDAAFIKKLGEQKTVLLIDQYEELITRCPNPQEREQFAALLRRLLDEVPDGRLKIILTVRADFEPQLDDGALKPIWSSGRCTVPPFSVEELKEVIVMPTLQEVLLFEPPELVDEIIAEVVQAPGALPLLSYTLSELYEAYVKSGRQDRLLKKEDYDQLGGVMGALRTKVDALYHRLDPGSQNTMRKLMLRMVSLEGELAGKRVLMDDLIYSEAAENERVHAVIDQLVEARLIVKGKDYVEPAHDALVRAWKMLREWIHAIGEDKIVLNAKVNVAAREYAGSHNVKFLWNDNPHLNVLQQDLRNPNQWFNAKEIDFIQKSVQRKKKRSLIFRSVTTAVILTLTALTIFAFAKMREADRERDLAREQTKQATLRLLSLQADAEWEGTQQGREGPATAKFLFENLPDEPLARAVIFKVLYSSYAGVRMQMSLPNYGPLASAHFAPAGDRLLLGLTAGDIVLTDLEGRELAHYPAAPGTELRSAAFIEDGSVLATYTDGSAVLWRGTERVGLESPGPEPIQTALSRDRTRLVTFTEQAAIIRDARGAATANIRVGDQERIHALSIADDGSFVALIVERAATDCRLDLYAGDGEAMATISPAQTWSLEQGECYGWQAIFAPDARTILLRPPEGGPLLVDFAGNVRTRFDYDKPFVDNAGFTPAGHVLTSFSPVSYGEVVVWEPGGRRLATLTHVNLVNTFAAGRDGTIATGSDDRSVKLWSAGGVEIFKREIAAQNEGVRYVEFSPDGRWLLVVHGDFGDADSPPPSAVELLSLDQSRVMKIPIFDHTAPSSLVRDLGVVPAEALD